MSESQSIGAIKVTRMIWTAVALSLITIYYCRFQYEGSNPTIMETGLLYPYTVYMRMGLMYSLFIIFLINFFIKWWIDSSQYGKNTKRITIFGTLACLSYALFVSTLDRKYINYNISKDSVFFAAIFNTICIYTMMKNIRAVREKDPYFIGEMSWKLKRVIYAIYMGGIGVGLLIYFGILDIGEVNILEYLTVTATYLFYWTFIFDFKGYTMDITEFIDVNNQTVNRNIQQPLY